MYNNTMVNLCKLKEIHNLRSVWPNEASDFTPWLAQDDNIAILADAVGIDIAVEETEAPIGDFSADIFATDTSTGRGIIIENQLECTNHDHLGKLITYAAGKSADTIIWIVKQARDEHKAAIEWLNNHTDSNIGFFLCEIKLYKIGNSEPAVKFDVIEQPNDWSKHARGHEETNVTGQQRYNYWVAFQKYTSNNEQFMQNFTHRKPSALHWSIYTVGSRDCHIGVLQVRRRGRLEIELFIGNNKDLYHRLAAHKDEIESQTGITFDWQELPNRKASRIITGINVDFDNTNSWPAQFDWAADTILKMKAAFTPYL